MSSIVSKQQLNAERSRKIFDSSLDEKYFNAEAEIEGNYADWDGFLRLRRWEGDVCHETRMVFAYQLKSRESLSEEFLCPRDLIDGLMDPEATAPQLLLLVDQEKNALYWFHFDHKVAEELNLDSDTKDRKIKLKGREVTIENAKKVHIQWLEIAEKFRDKKKVYSLSDVLNDFPKKSVECIGLLHLLKIIARSDAASIFAEVLRAKKDDIDFALLKLTQEQVLLVTHNYYLLDDDDLGSRCLERISDQLDVEVLLKLIKDKNSVIRLLRQMVSARGKRMQKFLKQVAEELLENINQKKDNDEIYLYLEFMDAMAQSVPLHAIKAVKAVMKRKPMKAKVRKTDWGPLTGRNHQDLIKQCLEVLHSIRYHKIRDVLNLLTTATENEDVEISGRATQVLKDLCEYNLNVVLQIGLGPQAALIDELEKWSDSKLKKNPKVTNQIVQELLEGSCEGTRMTDYKTMTIEWRCLTATDKLKEIRKRVISLLMRSFMITDSIKQKLTIMKALEQATKTPMRGRYEDDFLEMIINNTNTLIAWYLEKMDDMDSILLKELDEQKEWWIQSFGDKGLKGMERLESALSKDPDYKYFRILVGDDHGFSRDMQYGEIEDFRKGKISGFIEEINNKNESLWTQRILSIAQNDFLEERGELNYFRFFLFELSKQKPKLAYMLLLKNEKQLQSFLWPLLSGLCISEMKEEAKKLVKRWVEKKAHLIEATHSINCFDNIDEKLVETIFSLAKKQKSISVFSAIATAVSKKFEKQENMFLREIFVKSVRQLTKLHDTTFITSAWFHAKKLLGALDEKEAKTVLDNFVLTRDVDHNVEYALNVLAENHPLLIIQFFKKRVKHWKKKGGRFSYIAIPHDKMWDLSKSLEQNKHEIFVEIVSWYDPEDWHMTHAASELLLLLFGLEKIEDEVTRLSKSKKKQDTEIALSILKEQGKGALVSECTKVFIEHNFENKRYMSILGASMSATGVVTGEDGLLNAYKHKKQTMQKWQKDKRANVKKFAAEYEEKLNEDIENEEKRKNEELLLLKKGIH